MSHSLPILIPRLPGQRYSCHGCGHCCRDFTVQLREEDLVRLGAQGWEARLGEPVTMRMRGQHYLRRRQDGSCIFLMEDGKCRVHDEFGLQEKPVACRFFPFSLSPGAAQSIVGLNFACGSVLRSAGGELSEHGGDLARMARDAPETLRAAPAAALAKGLPSQQGELETLARAFDRWLSQPLGEEGPSLCMRMDGLAFLSQSLWAARLGAVRGDRLKDLLDLLVRTLEAELPHHPVEAATRQQMGLLRQSVFARIEDPARDILSGRGRLRTIIRQSLESGRFRRGRGEVPPIPGGFARARFADVACVATLSAAAEAAAIEEVTVRWLRARVLGGRAWGSGSYGWDAVSGLAALVLDAACAGWLARCHAAGAGRAEPGLEDAYAGIARVDRAAGRAPWLGGAVERLRLGFLMTGDGLRRVIRDSY